LADTQPTEPEIRQWCTVCLAKVLKVPAERIDPQATFARLGVDSAAAVFFVLDIEEWLDLELPASIAFEYPSIAELAGYLAKECAHRHGAARGSR
jgi:acyl carrier protein